MRGNAIAIVCGCEKFDQFIYGHKITIETNHKPLVSTSLQKPIHNAPVSTKDAPSHAKV